MLENSDWLMQIHRSSHVITLCSAILRGKMSSVEQILDIGTLETSNGTFLLPSYATSAAGRHRR